MSPKPFNSVLYSFMLLQTILGTLFMQFFAPVSYAVSYAEEHIVCRNSGNSDVVITLSQFQQFQRLFNCISGDFVVDLSGCAPDEAFGLHAPTGSADLVGVVDRWQDYAEHMGGITSNFETEQQIRFSGGFNSPDNGYEESWSFTVDRITGVAKLEQSDGNNFSYNCEKEEQKF